MGEHSVRFLIAFSIFLLAFAVAVVVSIYMVTAAHAQPACAPYQEVQKALREKFHEAPVSVGIAKGDKHVITVFTSPNGETWTIVVVDTSGMACLMSVGKNWSDVAEAKGEPS